MCTSATIVKVVDVIEALGKARILCLYVYEIDGPRWLFFPETCSTRTKSKQEEHQE